MDDDAPDMPTRIERAKLMRNLPTEIRSWLIKNSENVIDARIVFEDARKGMY